MTKQVTIEYEGKTWFMVPMSYASELANEIGHAAGCCAFCPFDSIDERSRNHTCTAIDNVHLRDLDCDRHEDRFDDAVKGVWVPQQMYIEWLLERDNTPDT